MGPTTPLTVTWFIPVNHCNYDRMPGSIWIRCLQLLPYLEEKGIHCKVNSPNAPSHVCVFVRWQNQRAFRLAEEQRRRGRRVVFDLCVNYFDETGQLGDGYGTTAKQVKECASMISLADVVTCASKFITQRAQAFHPWAVYIPDSIDQRHFQLRKPPKDFERDPLRAIWCGISSKAHELNPIIPILEARGIPLTIISDSRPKLAGKFSFIRWAYQTFPRHILDGEICVSHRTTENPYDLGHSLFKIGAFMAQGVPALASPVPSYEEVLACENGGRICPTLDEWAAAFDQLSSDRHILKRWSQQATAALEPYSTGRIVEQYVKLFKELLTLE